MEEVEGEPLFCERAAGIDIGKQSVFVTVRVPSEPARAAGSRRPASSAQPQGPAGAGGLAALLEVEKAGMESTSDYWKPVFFLLEREGFDCMLYQASQVKALPGRPKTDKLDSAWLAKITEQGVAGRAASCRRRRSAGCAPTPATARSWSRCRTAQKERSEKLLEDAHLKLSSVISDIHGVSGRAMLRAIIAGERSPKVLAEMARGVMRRKIARLEEALDCSFFTPEHAFILEMMLDSIDQLTAQIAVLDEKIAELCEPYERQIAQLDAIPGFGVTAAQDLIAEIGVDMSAFPTAGHLASWARVSAPRPGIGQAQGQERHRPRQPLHRRHPRRGRRQRRPHPDLPRRQAPAPVHGTCRRRKPRAPS